MNKNQHSKTKCRLVSSEPSIVLHSEEVKEEHAAGRWRRDLIYYTLIIVHLCEEIKKIINGGK